MEPQFLKPLLLTLIAGLSTTIGSVIGLFFKRENEKFTDKTDKKLLRTGLFVALGIGIHNFPEGMATFYSSLSDIELEIAIAVAIAIHNIPEGLAVSVPVY